MNLDQWKEEWVENMCIGNEELNKYWEGNSNAAMVKYKLSDSENLVQVHLWMSTTVM
jgi:hypothetical protein